MRKIFCDRTILWDKTDFSMGFFSEIVLMVSMVRKIAGFPSIVHTLDCRFHSQRAWTSCRSVMPSAMSIVRSVTSWSVCPALDRCWFTHLDTSCEEEGRGGGGGGGGRGGADREKEREREREGGREGEQIERERKRKRKREGNRKRGKRKRRREREAEKCVCAKW